MGTGGGWQDGLCPRPGWGRPARASGAMTRPSDHAAPLLRSSLVILHPPPRRRPCLPGTAAQPCSEVAARDEVGKERRPCLVSGITPMGPMGRTSLRLLRTALGLQAGGGGGARPDRGRAWGGGPWGGGGDCGPFQKPQEAPPPPPGRSQPCWPGHRRAQGKGT